MASGGCCTFGKRENVQSIIAARELTTQGLSAMHRGQCDEASRLLRQASEADPEDLRIRRHLASSLAQSGRKDLATWELKQTLARCEDDPSVHIDLGKLLLEQGEPHAASAHADKAIEIDHELAEAWLLKGRCDMAAGQHARAVPSLHRAANADPDCREAFLELAECWSATGEPLRALSALDLHNSQFAADQVPLRAVELTGRVLLDLGQHNRASRILAEATRRPETSRAVWLMLVESCHAGGDLVAAQQAARSAQQLYPEDPEISGLVAALNPPADNRLHAAR